jgi:hypothetical protein
MLTYQADSPSRMCVMVWLMRRPAWWMDLCDGSLDDAALMFHGYACLKHSYPQVDTHRLHFGTRVALSSRTSPNVTLSPDAASMQTQAAGHRGVSSSSSVLGMSHYDPQCAHTDDTAAPSSSGHSISTRH